MAAEDGHSVVLTKVTGIRSAAGYILKGTPNTNYRLTNTGTDPEGNSGTELKRASSDMNNFAATNEEGEYRYIIGDDEGTAKFFAPDGKSTLKKGKAYLETSTELSAPSTARGVRIIFDDETTGIEAIADKQMEGSKYFNLHGQAVKNPTKGLLIRNGKKVIIK